MSGPVTPARTLMLAVCERVGCTPARLCGPIQRRQMVVPRRALIRLLHEELGMSTPQIGRVVDRDHSTVMHHLRSAPYPAELPLLDELRPLARALAAGIREPHDAA